MNITKTVLQYDICEENTETLPVIIVAAGSSSRMNGINKQTALLDGVPVIIRTLLAFQNCEKISNIILVVRTDDIFSMQLLTEKYEILKLTDIVCGGNSRQESVLKGLARLKPTDGKVLIHDGARPLVDSEIISAVADALDDCKAVTCAVKVKDTVKEVDSVGKVVKTLKRESLVSVQTPQGVYVKEYKEAVDGITDFTGITDDVSIMEAAGYEVLTVDGSYKNIKITTPEDLMFAECLLKEEKE